jgi:3-hydroxyacyl-CoA dehydrogenase
MENKWLGSKTGQGFIKKVGKDILTLDLDTLEYRPFVCYRNVNQSINRLIVLNFGKRKR